MQHKGFRAVTPFILPSHRGHTRATTRHTCFKFDSTTIADSPSIQTHHTSHPPHHPTIEMEHVPSIPPLPTSLTPIAPHLQRKNRRVRVPDQEIICTKLHWQNHSNPQAHSTHRLLSFQRNLHLFSHRSPSPNILARVRCCCCSRCLTDSMPRTVHRLCAAPSFHAV